MSESAEIVPIKTNEIDKLASFATAQKIDLTVVGPEAPLNVGIVDHFQKQGLRIFGPNRKAAQVETSKTFAKELCFQHDIPTARWESFTEAEDAIPALDRLGPPWVVKADGLASGKGTTVTANREEAEDAVRRELQRESGKIVIEQFIDGWEASFLATVSAGHVQWLMPVFQDYKPAYDGDIGPNTGGMGAYTPVPNVTSTIVENVRERILYPFVKVLPEAQVNFQGVLYLNAIIPHGTQDPYVLEFNARFGDPEAQGILPLVKNGLARHLYDIAENSSEVTIPEMLDQTCVVAVIASKGYPTNPSIGDKIMIKPIMKNNVTIFHAGTGKNPNGELVTAGGRVLNVVATAANVESARNAVYNTIKESIFFNGMNYRSDIGLPQARRRKLERLE